MYHEDQRQIHRSRPRRGEKPHRPSPNHIPQSVITSPRHHFPPADRAHHKGIIQSRNRTYAPNLAVDSSCDSDLSIEENSFSFEFRQSSSKKASGTPIKTLIVEEMSKEVESKRPSPGVIARLMGIGTIPSSHAVPKQHKEMTNFQKTSTVGFRDKYATYEDHPTHLSSNDHQEFRDVFEVIEMSKAEKHKNQKFRKGIPNLKQDDTVTVFTKQNLLDAKRLPTDEIFQNYNDLDNATEALDYDKDLYLNFLQEPNSLFAKHIYDLKRALPSQHASHITILKSSKGIKRETIEISRSSGRNAERYTHVHRDAVRSRMKSVSSCGCHTLKERNCYVPNKFSESRNARSFDAYHDPTRIVVLKPNLEKAHNMAATFTSARSHEKYQFDFKRNIDRIGSYELHSKGKDLQKLSREDVMGYKIKNSKDNSLELAKQVRHNGNRSAEKAPASKFNWSSMDESACVESGLASLNDAQLVRWIDQLDDCGNTSDASSSSSTKLSVNKVSRKRLSTSSSYLTESSMNREARRRLSARWKMSHQLQQAGLVSKRLNTLREMLTISENETLKTTGSLNTGEVPNSAVVKDEALATRDYDFGISSKDGWRDRCSSNLLSSISYPAPSADYPNPKSSIGNRVSSKDFYMLKDAQHASRKESLNGKFCPLESYSVRNFKFKNNNLQFWYGGETYTLPERAIHVHPEELRSEIHAGYLADEKPVVSKLPEYTSCNTANKELVKRPMTSKMLYKDGEITYYSKKKSAIKETSIEHPQADSLPSYYNLSEFGSPISSNGTDQPSPVSVLELPSEEDKSGSGCFEKISANLQELRKQIWHLKCDSSDDDADELELNLSDEETGEYHSEMLREFKGEEDRDFSYLLDVVIESGVHDSDWILLFDTCYSAEYPVSADVFDKLEKKYSFLVSWSKIERKQLFDLINATLVGTILPQTNLRPWVKSRRISGSILGREDFIEELWQMVVRHRKGLINGSVEKLLELRWLDLQSDVDMIGMKIERMLEEDLLEELASELILKEAPQQAR